MKKSKLLSLLSAFSEEEMKQFEKFIISPFFNNERNFMPLYNILKCYHPEFDNPDLTEENIFKKLYPEKVFDKKSAVSIRVLESQMANLAEKFLKYNYDNNGVNEITSGINFLRVLNHRKLDKIFTSNLKTIEKSLGKEIDTEHNLFNHKMKLEIERCSFLLRRDRQQETSDHLLKQSEYLILNFLIELFQVKGHLELNKGIFNADFKVILFNEFLKNVDLEKTLNYMKTNSFEFYPVIAVYYNCMMAQLDVCNDSYFQNFKELLKNNIHLFSRGEKFVLFQDLTACCWGRLRNGNSEINKGSQKELFELYQYLFKKGLYKFDDKGFISLSFFRNVIINALNVREIDWLEIFLNKYKNELSPEIRDNLFNYGMAVVRFEKGDFEKSLELMTKVKYDYFYFRVDVKTWQLRIYYELNHIEQATSLIDTFKHFLSKNKSLSHEFRKPINEFLKYYMQIFKYKNGDNSISLKLIESEVSNIPHLNHKKWILRKIKELEKVGNKK